jgi:hypothetical protein
VTLASPQRRLLALATLLLLACLPALAQLPQQILFTPSPLQQAYAGTSVLLAATATSGLPVTFSVASGPAQVSGANGSLLTYTGVGSVVVQADQPGGSGFSPAPAVQAPAITVQLLTEPVTTRSPAVSTVITFTTSGTLAQGAALTQGATNLDFSLPTGTVNPSPTPCLPGTAYTVGQTCSLSVYFKPTHPGIRYGGLTLSDAQGVLLANAYIYGYGVGPQVLYQPILQTLVGNSLGDPTGVAANGYGDLFVSNHLGSALTEISANGTVTPIGTFNTGKDVAVDGSGNVFLVTDTTLFEITAVNGSIPPNPLIRTLTTGLTVDGGGLAIDGSGNAYIANSPTLSTKANPKGVLYVVYAVGGIIPTASPKQTIGPIFAEPTGVAVDSSGNVFLSDGFAPGIFEMLAVNGRVPASPVILKLGVGSIAPSNIRLDNTNDIFISDSAFPGILEYPAVNGIVDPATQPRPLGTGFIYPQGLLVDGSGNVFVADQGFPQVVKLNYSSVPTLTFQSTLVGQTSPDSPRAVTYTNAGNADLLFANVPSGNNPAITPGFSLDPTSTCPRTLPTGTVRRLPIGQSCTDQVDFTPISTGAQTGTLTTVDNDLSVPNATQIVQLNGNSLPNIPKIQFAVPNHFVDDPPFQLTSTSNSPAPISYTVTSGPATIAGSTLTLAGTVGPVVLVASQPATGPYAAGTATASFSVVKHQQTVRFTPLPTPSPLASSPLTLSATATSGLPVTFRVLSGPATVTGATLTLTGYGTVLVAADQPGNTLYDPAPEVSQSVLVVDNRITITLTGTPNPVFLHNPITFTSTVTSPAGNPTGTILFLDGGVPLTTVPLASGSATLITSTLALGPHLLTAVYSGDPFFAAATSTQLRVLVEDFSLILHNPDLTIPHGGTAIYNLTVTTVGGASMASTIQFAIAGAPDHSKITFSPAILATNSGTTDITLTIETPDYPVGPWGLVSGQKVFASLALGTLVLFRRRRRIRLLALALVCLTTSGCGSGWRTQHYPITISAISGSLSHTANASLTSQ